MLDNAAVTAQPTHVIFFDAGWFLYRFLSTPERTRVHVHANAVVGFSLSLKKLHLR